MRLRQWTEVVDLDMPPRGPVTARAREYSLREARLFRGGVRISTGMFWTDREYEAWREKMLNTPLL